MPDKKITYTLTMSSAQCHEVNKAVELLMRLKINQPEEIPDAILNWGKETGISCDEWCKRRDRADPYLRLAFKELFPDWPKPYKDHEWHVLYDLYQVIRKAIHDAEHPETTGVDAYPFMCTAGEEPAKCEWRKNDGQTGKGAERAGSVH